MKIAKRLSGITASPTLAVMQEAQRLRQQGVDVIDFGPGEPDFPTPEPVKEAAIEAIRRNFTKYTAAAGLHELRQAVADKYNQEWGSDFTVANVIITCGAKHAIYQASTALFEEGDEVVIPAPYWVTFPEIVRMADARPVELATSEESGFVLEPRQVESALTSHTRGLIVNSPNNPTGAVLPGSALKELVELCRGRNVFLMSDETYEYFVYDDHPHVSLASLVGSDEEGFALVGSLSKTYSMTGWRIGYCVAHQSLIKKIGEFQSHQSGNAASISQKAALAALRGDPELVAAMKREYEVRRQMVLDGLDRILGFACPKPFGAFYAFPNVSEAMRIAGVDTSQEFSRFLIQEARVATVPGSAFGMEGHIRLSYATSRENLREGLSRIRAAVEKFARVG